MRKEEDPRMAYQTYSCVWSPNIAKAWQRKELEGMKATAQAGWFILTSKNTAEKGMAGKNTRGSRGLPEIPWRCRGFLPTSK